MTRYWLIAACVLGLVATAAAQNDFSMDGEFGTPPKVANASPPSAPAAGSVPCTAKFVRQPIIAAREAGVLLIAPEEGQYVEKGDLIGQTDYEDAQLAAEVASYGVLALEKEVDSDIRMRYSKASEDVAKLDFIKSRQANERTPGAIPFIELKQKEFRYTEAKLGYENTVHEQAITEINLSEKKAEYKRAMAMVERHNIKSPIRGMVAEVMEREGEYVRPGDPVAQIVQLDEVKIIAKLTPDEYPMNTMQGRSVRITMDLGGGQKEVLDGVIKFVDKRIDASRTYEVWALVDVPNENIFDERKGVMEFVN